METVVIEKGNILRLIWHLKPDNPSSPDDSHHRIMKALKYVIAGPLAILFNTSLQHHELSADRKNVIISPVHKARRDLVTIDPLVYPVLLSN